VRELELFAVGLDEEVYDVADVEGEHFGVVSCKRVDVVNQFVQCWTTAALYAPFPNCGEVACIPNI
jgi:hypothetical protein